MDHDTESFFEIDRLLRKSGRPDRMRTEVLVVDDEPYICSIVEEILSPRGYVVHQAHSGAAAMEFLQQQGKKIGLVLIDVVMPSMDGLSLLSAVRKRDPALSIVLVSGRLSEDTRWLASERGCRFLAKPFEVAELGQLARELLGSPGEMPVN